MSDTPTPHLPTFRRGEDILIEFTVRNRADPGRPPWDPPGGVRITILRAGAEDVGINDVVMTPVTVGLYRMQWASPLVAGLYTASVVARTGTQDQQSQTYALMKLVP